MIAFANAQHNAHAAQDDAHVAIQMQGPLSLLVIRALRGVLGDMLSNRAYWVQMGLTRYIEFSTVPNKFPTANTTCPQKLIIELPNHTLTNYRLEPH